MKHRPIGDRYCSKTQFCFISFFLSGFPFTGTDNLQDSRGRERTSFYSTLPLPPTLEDSDIYLRLCTWGDYHIFLIATLVFTRLLFNEIYHMGYLHGVPALTRNFLIAYMRSQYALHITTGLHERKFWD